MTAAAFTRLVIADDHPLFRDALRQAVASVVTSAKIGGMLVLIVSGLLYHGRLHAAGDASRLAALLVAQIEAQLR